MTKEESKIHRYVLIDDDPTYQSIMKRFSKEHNMHLEVYENLVDLGSVGLLGRYDAAIVDYDLGQINGVEVAEYLSVLFGDIPTILVSDRQRNPSERQWPNSIKRFVKKSQGYAHVLNQARKSLLQAKENLLIGEK